MTDKIRVQCEECGKKLAVRASAAGRKIKCPGCELMIKVPRPGSGRPSAGADDPYTAPPGRKKTRASAGAAKPHWSRNPLVGVGAILITVIASGLQTVIQGAPNLKTAEGKGQLAGQLFVLVVGVVAGIVIVVRSLLGRSGRR
ncbi:MAG: zinc-ribbon domain-containing protein [Planctomycetaceae bacterium]|nr:zinc-ribbon domain-containing protein [Planctomycetaceae bacterium]